jgi:hypothetical protein
MARTPKFTDAQIEAALLACGGIQTRAAALLTAADAKAAEKTGRQPRTCVRTMITMRISKSPALRQACDEARDEFLDLAESKLREGVAAGSEKLVVFALETLGKNRGYSKRVEQTGVNGGPMEMATKAVLFVARGADAVDKL